ncbi:MAG: MerR family transcriptional regulator [Acidobacteria bacterium]|nr:MAG: MerR family transcriptional regulator [Acidobacteriota bacterium]
MVRKKGRAAYMISAVAEQYGVHPQTLRLYEREGLLKPSRTEGNTRLYTEEDLQRLEVILSLTRDMGVNLAGVEVILNLRERMQQMQQQMQEFVDFVQHDLVNRGMGLGGTSEALVPVRQGPGGRGQGSGARGQGR